jgi:hypothetical protein
MYVQDLYYDLPEDQGAFGAARGKKPSAEERDLTNALDRRNSALNSLAKLRRLQLERANTRAKNKSRELAARASSGLTQGALDREIQQHIADAKESAKAISDQSLLAHEAKGKFRDLGAGIWKNQKHAPKFLDQLTRLSNSARGRLPGLVENRERARQRMLETTQAPPWATHSADAEKKYWRTVFTALQTEILSIERDQKHLNDVLARYSSSAKAGLGLGSDISGFGVHAMTHAPHIDLSSIEGRTAASTRAAMITAEIQKLTFALHAARARGHSHEVSHIERRIHGLMNERAHIFSALQHSNPLPGIGGFGMNFGASASAVAAKEQADVRRIDDRIRSLEAQKKKLQGEIAGFKKDLAKAGALNLGKKSYLKGEVDEREKAIGKINNEISELGKKRKTQFSQAKEATALAVQPAKVAADLKKKLDLAQSEANRLGDQVRALTKSIEAFEKDLKSTSAIQIARRAYINKEIDKKRDQRSDVTKKLTKVTSEIKELSEKLGKAKTYSVVASSRQDAVAAVSTAALPVNDRIKVQALESQLSTLEKEADELEKGINAGLKSGKDSTALLILLNKRRDLGDTIRAKLFERDEKAKGRLVALNNRLTLDRSRVQSMESRIRQVKASSLSDAAKKPLLGHFAERLQVAKSNVEGTEKQIKGFFTRKVVKFAPLRTVSANQLGVVKRQLALNPNARQPSKALLAALAARFAQSNPPQPGESAEQYLTRLKLYTARGAVVASNAIASGTAPATAVNEAVKDVVVNDAPALEQEAKSQVSAPAGEQAVATQVTNHEEVIVQAAAAAAPELMQTAMPVEAVQAAAAEGASAAAAVTTDPAAAAQAEDAAASPAAADGKAEITTSEEDAGDEKPWYSKPSGMVLIGIAAIIGYKALASKE